MYILKKMSFFKKNEKNEKSSKNEKSLKGMFPPKQKITLYEGEKLLDENQIREEVK